MKKLLLLPLLLSNTLAQERSFRGTVFDLDSGRVQVIRGEIEKPYQPYQPQIDAYRRIIADTQASIDRMRAESEARAQLRELREQTELLRKIANE
jgi:glycosylphosphatidylinositol transamidase (GPIT) subunit GPI8